MHDQPLSLIDRFILFYLQGKGMEQKYMAVDRLESRAGISQIQRIDEDPRMFWWFNETLQATSLREGCDSAANFGRECWIFQGREIDLDIR